MKLYSEEIKKNVTHRKICRTELVIKINNETWNKNAKREDQDRDVARRLMSMI
jgi:hypothetical protein